MVDPFTLGAAVAAILAPLLGRAGGAAADRIAAAAGEALGNAAASRVRTLWRRLQPGLDDTPDAARAVAGLSVNPRDPSALTVLGDEIGYLLDADPAVRRLAVDLVKTARGASIAVHGDGNTVQSGHGNMVISDSSGVTVYRNGP
jgi:hypothetical protein